MSTTLASNASGQSMEQDESRDSFSPDDVGTSTDSEVDDPGDVQELHEKSRRTAQNELFKALISEAAHSASKDLEIHSTRVKAQPEESIQHLIANHDFAAGTMDPREYQLELFEKAKKENTIAVLDTGSGKTLIAVLLLKHTIQNELIARSEGRQPRISFFLVDSVTLVYQQTAVLQNNLDQKVSQLFGAMNVDLWSKEIWDHYFESSMVIVCTADVLHQCLLNSYITMEKINLLIFDEAHHTKKDHPYARIIKDAYLKTSPEQRPRIFGMTASPVDSRGDVVKAAQTLETLLHSRIATTSNLALLHQVVRRPQEEVWRYPRLGQPLRTELYDTMEKNFGHLECLEATFKYALSASAELGPWFSDRVWKHALAEEMLPKLHGKISTKFKRLPQADAMARVEAESRSLQEAATFVANHLPDKEEILSQLSPKVHLLYQKLSQTFQRCKDTKCIVFTQQRHTARLLEDLFRTLEVPNLYPGVLVGIRSGDVGGINTTYRQQFKVMTEFKKGDINCLFATSVAEEGLDIPDCNLVVRFDLYDTLIQYIQSRGRARHANSTYAHMIESGNVAQETKLEEVREAEELMRRFCECLPKDRLLEDDEKVCDLLQNESQKRTYRIARTGATLTYHSALSVLARYASSLQFENETCPKVNYFVFAARGMFVCEVILPEKSPVRRLFGKPATQKMLAKQSAAFDMCILLRKEGLLDEFFMSTYRKRLPLMRNAKLAIATKKTNQYRMITKPAIWDRTFDTAPEVLYLTIIILRPARNLSRSHQSIILLTRTRLPQFPEFPIYLEDDVETTVQTVAVEKALPVSSAALDLLTTFTLRVFKDLYNKVYSHDSAALPYWLAPGLSIADVPYNEVKPFTVIDWDMLQYISDNESIPSSGPNAPEDMKGRFIYDQWDGRYRYFVTGVNQSLRPTDPPPPFVARRRFMNNIMEYCLSLYRNSRPGFLARCDWNQPVYDAELVPLRRNFLDKSSEKDKTLEKRSVVCLAALTISAIPAPVAATCFAFPAIITRLESYLIAQDACKSLQLKIKLTYALEALTKDSDNTEEHRDKQVHFQRGMGKNYERLEFLGDSFLKMATSIALFAQNPHDKEFDYHVNRMCLICNKNLFKTAKERKIYEFIRTKGFSRRNWYPRGLKLLQGKGNEGKNSSDGEHALGEKTIADVCEALIGACLMSGGPEHRFDMATKAVTVMVNSPSHQAQRWGDYYALYSLPSYQIQTPDGFEIDLAQKVEQKLGYHFKHPRLLRSAFTHPSYPLAWAKVPCYQRLEFLGDSLLEMACIEDLFHRFPSRDPQWLTEHKMAIVSNKFLGALAVKLDLHTHLQHFSSSLTNQITQYAEETKSIIQSNSSVDFWLLAEDPPKCLPDIIESYIGAIFVDSCFNFGVVEDFYRRHISPYFKDMSLYDSFANKHPTTFLHNRLTKEFGCAHYSLKSGEIPSVDGEPPVVLAALLVHETVLAKATASSSRYAKIKASQAALERLERLAVSDFREQYRCDCSQTNPASVAVEAMAGSAV